MLREKHQRVRPVGSKVLHYLDTSRQAPPRCLSQLPEPLACLVIVLRPRRPPTHLKQHHSPDMRCRLNNYPIRLAQQVFQNDYTPLIGSP